MRKKSQSDANFKNNGSFIHVSYLFISFYTHDKQLSSNPSSPQLFITQNPFNFEFVTEEDLLVTIKTICGQGKLIGIQMKVLNTI